MNEVWSTVEDNVLAESECDILKQNPVQTYIIRAKSLTVWAEGELDHTRNCFFHDNIKQSVSQTLIFFRRKTYKLNVELTRSERIWALVHKYMYTSVQYLILHIVSVC